MCEEIRLAKYNDLPWGFRLTGGRDFGTPLTVIRITGGSIASKCGLRVCDIVTEINNQSTVNLTHNEAQRCIRDAGNYLELKVLRGKEPVTPSLVSSRGTTPIDILKKKNASTLSVGSINSLYEDDSFEFIEHSEIDYEENRELTEDEIAEMLLENTEVIEEKGKHVLGVNFKRFIPKCDFIKDSAVFQVLQEEQVYKEMTEKEQLARCPTKRFSTFLYKPAGKEIPRPKPRSNTKVPDEIEKDLNGRKMEEGEEGGVDVELEADDEKESETAIVLRELKTCSPCEMDCKRCEMENEVEITEITSECDEEDNCCGDENCDADAEDSENQPDAEEIAAIGGEEEGKWEETAGTVNPLEQELHDIKNKLNALGQLPNLIETQLRDVQTQINNLLNLNNVQSKSSKDDLSACVDEFKNDGIEETGEGNSTESDLLANPESNDGREIKIMIEEVPDEKIDDAEENVPVETSDKIENADELWENGKSCASENIRDEFKLEIKKKVAKKSKERPMCPLTPLPRPVVLPGGRIWRKPKDAFNEEFIAETLISQAEVLVGSTLGVNFRKYEPPKFDMSNSAVYKLVHNIESKKCGLENRPEIVPAEQDYYQSPISAKHFYLASLAEKANSKIYGEEDCSCKEEE